MNEYPPLLTGEALVRARWAELERVLAANPEIMQYVPEDDTLFVDIGPRRAAVWITLDDRLYFRVDPTTYALVGLAIEGFRGAS